MELGTWYKRSLLGLASLATVLTASAQHEELKQNLEAFEEYMGDQNYEKKEYNYVEPEWGAINESDPDWHVFYQLKSLEKREDNLERNKYHKIDFALYAWDNEDDGEWALKSWMENFLEGKD